MQSHHVPERRGISQPEKRQSAHPANASSVRGGGFASERHDAHCACGGSCPRCQEMVPVQAKLAVNQPGDAHEQQADRFADNALHPAAPARQETAPISPPTPGAVKSSQLAVDGESLQGSGQALPESDRHFFESRLGHNLSDVRIHNDAQAARAAQTLSAQAFTHGRDVYFGAGKFQPHAAEGRRLLAHELAHTVQQAAPGGAAARQIMRKPLAGETADAYKRRQEIIDDAKATIQTLEHCLAKKIPCGDETLTPTGDFKINGWREVITESAATHDGRLNQLVTDLKDIEHQLESAPPSAGALADVKQHEGNGMQIFTGSDLDNMYVNYAIAHGLTFKIATLNALYIDHVVEKKHQTKPPPGPAKQKKKPSPPVKKTVPPVTQPAKKEEAEAPRHFEEKTPYTIVVPDPQNAPLVYHVLQSGFDDNRGHILDVFRDEKGHFYRGYRDQKVYLPHWQDPR